jgi:hypothetical protein
MTRRAGLLAAAGMIVAVVAVLALWAASPSWLLPIHRAVIDALRLAGQHWLNAAAIAATATVAAVSVPLLMRGRERPQIEPSATSQARAREVMLRRVRSNWITGVLEPSLGNVAQLGLALKRRSEVLGLGSQAIRRPDQESAPRPHPTSILRAFDEAGGRLLIMGSPGAGKTTLLLQLADELLDRAEHDASRPIPVVVNLASWGARLQPLGAWLVDELAISYSVPRRVADTWIAADQLVLLLDGLDEVSERHRFGCAAAINTYCRGHGLVQIVVASRSSELQKLTVRLELQEAVELQPATDTQIETYLDHLERAGNPQGDVRDALVADRSLHEFLRSPLMLHAVTLGGWPISSCQQPTSAEMRRLLLWREYLERMFQQRPLRPRCGYTFVQAVLWLAWLACRLQERGQTEFHLDRLTPDWLPIPASQARARIRRGLIGATARAGKPVEQLRWSWQDLSSGLPILLGAGLAAGLITGPAAALVAGFTAALAAGLTAAFSGGPLFGFTAGLLEERSTPNEGIRRSANNGTRIGVSIGFVAGMVAWLRSGLAAGLVFGITLGLVFGLVFGGGACLQHYTVRALLARADVAPWRYGRFLEAMVERQVLRRSGSSYLFVDRTLRDYLADNTVEDILREDNG